MTNVEGSSSLWEPIRLRVSAWLLLAVGLVRSVGRRHAEAEAAYRDVLERHPGSDVARLMLGDSLEGRGRWEEAAAVYAEMAARDPTHENAHYHRACCLVELGRLEEAAEECGRTIGIDPEHFAAYVVLGQALGRLERNEEAIAAYRKALEIKPRDRDAMRLLAGRQAMLALDSERLSKTE